MAIVDLGSNTLRLIAFRVEGESFQSALSEKVVAGLAGLVRGDVLTPKGIEAALRAPAALKGILDTLQIADIRR
ncbi:MAG: hypothetical protein LBD02_09245 [Christensenellaceae bacterium]|nr:hypothetical protein [Christensenellaceae bacterium]